MRNFTFVRVMLGLSIFAGAGSLIHAASTPASASAKGSATAQPQQPHFSPPLASAIPPGKFGESVVLGRNIFTNTQQYAKKFVGNGLNCVNCHLDDGRKADAAPLWAAYVKYPAYREKNNKVNSYEDHLAGCFRFSMNGTAPAYDSEEMVALVALLVGAGRAHRCRSCRQRLSEIGSTPAPTGYCTRCVSIRGELRDLPWRNGSRNQG